MDFETRSAADIKSCGAWRYSEDATCRVICCAVSVDEAEPELLYFGKYRSIVSRPGPEESWLRELARKADTIEAHNVAFELAVWQNVLVRKHGWEPLPLHKLDCTAVRARMAGLPGSLEKACEVAGVSEQKDRTGYRLMLRVCCPKSREPLSWNEGKEDLEALGRYCQQDVRSEMALSRFLPQLSPAEKKVFAWDLEVGMRGFKVDQQLARAAIDMVAEEERKLTAELQELSQYKLKTGKQVQAMLDWLEEECDQKVEDLKKKTVRDMLRNETIDPRARRMLEIRVLLSKSSPAKYKALLAGASEDSCLRQSLMFHGAGTGRWSAQRFQPHNLPRGDFKDVDVAVRMLRERLFDGLDYWYRREDGKFAVEGDAPGYSRTAVASTCIRSSVVARDGMKLVPTDLSAIEARVTAWLADEEGVLETYRAGLDNYKATYASMYGLPYEKVTKKQRNEIGKPCVLLLGFGGGWRALARGTDDYFGEEDGLDIVDLWRSKHRNICGYWRSLERAARNAIENPGSTYKTSNGKVMFKVWRRWLIMKLPSGRCLFYCDPKFGDDGISFWGVHPKTRKWSECSIWGGTLMENAVQAIARDVLVHGMLLGEANGYKVVFHVHDEAVAEVPLDFGSAREYEAILSTPPEWAKALPLGAEGFETTRYRK